MSESATEAKIRELSRQLNNADRCPYCRTPLDDNGVPIEGKHDPDCADRALEASELKQLFRHRLGEPKKTETRNPDTGRIEWEAYQVTTEENLTTVLNSPLRDTVITLMAELAALTQLTAAVKGAQTDKEGGPSATVRLPSLTPAWADKRLEQVATRLNEEALGVAAWVNHPSDPDNRIGCGNCGSVSEKGDLYCRQCGTPTLRAYRRCGLCNRPRKDCRHTYQDLVAAGIVDERKVET